MTVQEFDDFVAKLWAHDWYYMMSDDITARKAGSDARLALTKQIRGNPILLEAFRAVSYTYPMPHSSITMSVGAAKARLAELRAELTEGETA
jgi:hypothetical protein